MRMARKFKWDMWDYDCDGLAYIIAKDECPNKSDVPQYIVEEDGLHRDVLNPELGDCLCEDIVQEGWCKYMVRSDWDNAEGPCGGYCAQLGTHSNKHKGWFPVWIVRVGYWY